MPTQGKSSRPGLAGIGPEHTFTTPKAARTRVTQERLSKIERETDDHRLSQRQKQIDFGKNTTGYLNYVSEVPIDGRSKADPWTPDIHKKYPKRVWDVIVRTWRRQLHKYDIDAPSTMFKDSPPLSQPHSPLNLSIGSEEDTIDYFNDAMKKFHRGDVMEPTFEMSAFAPSHEPTSSSYEPSYDYDPSPSQVGQFGLPTSSSQMTPYASSAFAANMDDSNASMDSMTSGTPSFYSESATSDYMSENSSDSWASVPLTPISLLGSPFARSSSTSFASSQSAGPTFTTTTSTTPFHPRGLRSASQHYTSGSATTSSASQHYQTPSSALSPYAASSLTSPSPYGAIGPIPRFSLAAATSSSAANSSFVPKLSQQDENVENTSMWHLH